MWIPLWTGYSSPCLHEAYSLIRWRDDKNKEKKYREGGRFLVLGAVEEEGAPQVNRKSLLQEMACELVSSELELQRVGLCL